MKDLHLLGNRILIKEYIEELKTASGIFIAPISAEKPKYLKGKVIKVSKWINNPILKTGYDITFNRLKSEPFVWQGEEYWLAAHDDIIGIME